MKKASLLIIIIFIIAALCGLWLFAPFSEPAPEFFDSENRAPEKIFERDEKIQSETDALLGHFDRMPPVEVFLTDEPVIKTGTNTERGVGYTSCDDNATPKIFIKKAFYRNGNQKQRVNILKHELTHAYLCRKGRMSGHDELFRKKFKEVGGFGN